MTEVSEEQSTKAEFPILVTLLGIVIEVSDVHSPKALVPILVRLSPIIRSQELIIYTLSSLV